MKLRILDAFVAKYILKLPDVGYYRRMSAFNTRWEKCKQHSEDLFCKTAGLPIEGQREQTLYYGKEGVPLRYVPEFTKDLTYLPNIINAIHPLRVNLYLTRDSCTVTLASGGGLLIGQYNADKGEIMYGLCSLLWKYRKVLREMGCFKITLADVEGEKVL